MDASAYLKSQGWLGTGNSLTLGKGLARPLLVSKKQNTLGIGKKKHIDFADQWWSRAFDSALEGLSVNKTEDSGKGGGGVTVTQTQSGGVLEGLATGAGAGLYSFFVKGQGLRGTIQEIESKGEIDEPRSAKRKRVIEDTAELGSEGQKKRGKAKTKDRVPSVAVAIGGSSSEDKLSKKERRRKKRETKALKLLKAEGAAAPLTPSETETSAEKDDLPSPAKPTKFEEGQRRKLRKSATLVVGEPTPTGDEVYGANDKAMKKEKRRKKREAKALKELLVLSPPETDQSVEQGDSQSKENQNDMKDVAKGSA